MPRWLIVLMLTVQTRPRGVPGGLGRGEAFSMFDGTGAGRGDGSGGRVFRRRSTRRRQWPGDLHMAPAEEALSAARGKGGQRRGRNAVRRSSAGRCSCGAPQDHKWRWRIWPARRGDWRRYGGRRLYFRLGIRLWAQEDAGAGGGPLGGRARTSLYGIEADGYKFIYVFDRSGSMGGSGRNTPLSSAKANLLASLESLGDTHQFQIIFYNEKPTMFALAGHPDRLVFGQFGQSRDGGAVRAWHRCRRRHAP